MPDISPDRIVLAREARGFSQRELAEMAGITQGSLSRCENGLNSPKPDVLERLAQALQIPISFFEVPSRPVLLPLSFYRRRASVGAKILRTIEARIAVTIEQIGVLAQSVDMRPIQVVPVDMDSGAWSPPQVASRLRQNWLLPRGPIPDMIGLLESKGIICIPFDFGIQKIDAVSLFPSGHNSPPLVFFNNSMPTDRIRFTIAHELGHLMMHEVVNDLERDIEDEANEFASEFLMPAAEIRPQLERLNFAKLARLKETWRVSMGALLHRAKGLGTISSSQSTYWWKKMSRMGYRKTEPIELSPEKPQYLIGLIEVHRKDLEYTTSELAASLHMEEEEFADQYLPSGAPQIRIVKHLPGK